MADETVTTQALKTDGVIAALETLLDASQIGELFGCDREIVAREARKGKLPPGAAIQIAKRWVFDPSKMTDWVPPEKGVYGGRKREDGRKRYGLYLHEGDAEAGIPDEVDLIKGWMAEQAIPEDCLVDPRKKSKAKAKVTEGGPSTPGPSPAPAAEPSAEEDAFADFALEE